MTPHTPRRGDLRAFTVYAIGVSCYGWAPVFFLYMRERFSLGEVLLLESIYYITVVLMEVPSGYLSDRFGRRRALIASAGSLCGSYALFALSQSFLMFAIAQVMLALGIAMNSGTDASFHLDALRRLGRAREYGAREARLGQWMLWASAISALAGGALSVLDMRLAYAWSALAALAALGAALCLVEPRRDPEATTPLGATLRRCAELVRSPRLRWLFAFAACAIVLNHIPYEFYQPYIARLAESEAPSLSHASGALTGVHVFLVQASAGWMAGRSIWVSRRLGLKPALLLTMALQLALIGAMSLTLNAWVAAALVTRGWPGALQRAPLHEAITPQLPASLSATYLSLQSLTGRLGFGALLLLLAAASEAAGSEAPGGSLAAATGLAASLWLALLVTGHLSSRRRAPRCDS